MTSLAEIGNIPVSSATGATPLVHQLADLRSSTVPGELDRQNGQWMLILSANLAGQDLRLANKAIKKALADAGAPPRGVTAVIRGQVNALQQIFGELAIGLVAAIGVILLLLTANFQSWKLALVVLSTAPAVLAGSVLMLLMTGTTLNLESFMGTIMAIGVAVANAILLVTFAEQNRRRGASALGLLRLDVEVREIHRLDPCPRSGRTDRRGVLRLQGRADRGGRRHPGRDRQGGTLRLRKARRRDHRVFHLRFSMPIP